MGYTHYWTQRRNLTIPEWQQIITDLRVVIDHAINIEGIALANGNGKGGTAPEINDDRVSLNGIGEGCHETFVIFRKVPKPESWQTRGGDFCKTERKPYDRVVTACLAYLSTVTRKEDPATHEPIIGTEVFDVSSDGNGKDFLAGVDLVRASLPRVANHVDIPMGVMKSDRWCAPWINMSGGGGGCTPNRTYELHFCIDGKGYVMKRRTGASYCFESHKAMAIFLDSTKAASFSSGGSNGLGRYGREEPNIWGASGSFDEARHNRIKRAQERVLAKLFPVDPACAFQPPAYVRPGDMLENAGREFCYSLSDLLNLAQG